MGGWGGRREKKQWKSIFIHPDAETSLELLFTHCEVTWQGAGGTIENHDVQVDIIDDEEEHFGMDI